jgi:hypothetical protein
MRASFTRQATPRRAYRETIRGCTRLGGLRRRFRAFAKSENGDPLRSRRRCGSSDAGPGDSAGGQNVPRDRVLQFRIRFLICKAERFRRCNRPAGRKPGASRRPNVPAPDLASCCYPHFWKPRPGVRKTRVRWCLGTPHRDIETLMEPARSGFRLRPSEMWVTARLGVRGSERAADPVVDPHARGPQQVFGPTPPGSVAWIRTTWRVANRLAGASAPR